jgi:hypothetical protein
MDINFTQFNKRLNYSLINIHAPTNASEEEAKDQFYEQLVRTYAARGRLESNGPRDIPCKKIQKASKIPSKDPF